MMLGLRRYLVPQLETQNQITYFLNHFPAFFIGFAQVLFCCSGWYGYDGDLKAA